MIIKVNVKPNSRKNEIEILDDFTFRVRIASPPVDGKANRALIEYLSEVFEISKSKIQLKKGETKKIKWIDLDMDTENYRKIIEQIKNVQSRFYIST